MNIPCESERDVDLFVSYARADNQHGSVGEVVERIASDFRQYTGENLRYFLDQSAIEGMDDWRHRILDALRRAKVILLFLSPAYLQSDYCRWEIVEYLKFEHARAVAGQGIAPIYFAEIHGQADPNAVSQENWLTEVLRRNFCDLRPWFTAGQLALREQDVGRRLAEFGRSIHHRITQLKQVTASAGNIPPFNARFVGRTSEMRKLHEAVGLGQLGIVTAVHGLAGLGKSALAVQYAHAYADFYPGGRWLVRCAGQQSLGGALRTLDVDLGISIQEDSDDRAARRILSELRRVAVDAQRETDHRNIPRTLLILDNVDHANLFHTPQADIITGQPWLSTLATTRLGPELIGVDPLRQICVAVDELSTEDGIRLIESTCPQLKLVNTERAAATEIVTLLQGFTLAIEVAAIFLAEHADQVTCADLLNRLRQEGLEEFETIAQETRRGILHGEKLVAITLKPTFESLSPEEQLVLTYASFLHPDEIPWNWLREISARQFPALSVDAAAGYEDPWMSVVNHLCSLRLLQPTSGQTDQHSLRMCRLHRLVRSYLSTYSTFATREHFQAAFEWLQNRASHVKAEWLDEDVRWEIAPLASYTETMLDSGDLRAPLIARFVASALHDIGALSRAEEMYRRMLACLESHFGKCHSEIAMISNNFASMLTNMGKFDEAVVHLQRANALMECQIAEDLSMAVSSEPSTTDEYIAAMLRKEPEELRWIAMSIRGNLAETLTKLERYAEAKPIFARLIPLLEREFGHEDPTTLTTIENFAGLLSNFNEIDRAERLQKRVLAARERVLGPEHPQTLWSINNLGLILVKKNDFKKAHRFFQQAYRLGAKVLGPDHYDTLRSCENLAHTCIANGQLSNAATLLLQAIEGQSKVFGSDHPLIATNVQTLINVFEWQGDYTKAEEWRKKFPGVDSRLF